MGLRWYLVTGSGCRWCLVVLRWYLVTGGDLWWVFGGFVVVFGNRRWIAVVFGGFAVVFLVTGGGLRWCLVGLRWYLVVESSLRWYLGVLWSYLMVLR